jgi:TDP-4-amino-4,6-dideoxy-D-glucose deaminase
MNQLIIELAKIFEGEAASLNQALVITDRLFPNLENKELVIKILRELFLGPYLTSKELAEKLNTGKREIKEAYSFIGSVPEIRDLWELSPYPYLIKVLDDLTKEEGRTLKIIKGEAPFPLTKTMELFISQACNADCKFCYRNGGGYTDKEVLSPKTFVDLINEFADLKGEYLDVCGGLEPLLGPAIIEVLRAGVERELKVCLYTNGIALDKPGLLDHLLKINKIRVSLNAYDKENYKDIIGVDKFDKVKDNIAGIIKARKDTGSKVKIGISFVVSKENYARIPEVIGLAQGLGVDFLDLRNIHVTAGRDFNDLQKEELQSALKQIKRGILSGSYGNLKISIADTFNFIVQEDGLLKNLKSDFANALINFRVTVSPSGKVYALNVIAQPTREDPRYLYGELKGRNGLTAILETKKDIPFEPELFLPHDISLVVALYRLKSDLEFGIGLEENPFNF